jgi:heat shock protein HtpX
MAGMPKMALSMPSLKMYRTKKATPPEQPDAVRATERKRQMFRRSSINQHEWFRHNWQNRLQTAVLLAFLGGYLYLVGWLIWGSAATVLLLALSASLLLLAPAQSPHLFMKLSGARPLNRWQNPELYRLTDGLAKAAELENAPDLYLLPNRQPNAFATGDRKQPIIAVSNGLLQLLNQRELKGVLAHEVSHLRHGDIRVMRLADMAARLTGSLSLFGQILFLLNFPLALFAEQEINWLLVFSLIFAPQVSSLAQLGLSRVREYNADLGAARLTGDPQALASALLKIERTVGGFMQRILGNYRLLPDWLRTHPPTKERVQRLLQLTDQRSDAQPGLCRTASGGRIVPAPLRPARGLQVRPVPVVVQPSSSRPRRIIIRNW